MKSFWIGLSICALIFAVLFSVRLGLFDSLNIDRKNIPLQSIKDVPARDSWMNIFQSGRKIGSSHATFSKIENGYRLEENIYLRLNTMGLVQDINLMTSGRLNPDFSLASFDFKIGSGRFHFEAQGTVSGDLLSVKTLGLGSSRQVDIKIDEKIYIVPGILRAVIAGGLEPGEEFAFKIFDPATMAMETIIVRVIGQEEIENMGRRHKVTKVSLRFKEMIQLAWIAQNGEILKEKGLLGISLEKTTRDEALFSSPIVASQDLTKVASVLSNVRLDDADNLTRLEVEIGGINYDGVNLQGGRQTFANHILTIAKEDLAGLLRLSGENKLSAVEREFLKPTLFVQSDHPKVRKLVQQIVTTDETPLQKAMNLIAWIHKNIEKRPVLSMPDALAILENRMGDCNEHAVLLAALARAAGIPAKVEAGLVYLNGRFYYHAWNLLYLGRWITADALFNQIPADVTHLRFASGSQRQQLDLMNIIGKIKLTIINYQ